MILSAIAFTLAFTSATTAAVPNQANLTAEDVAVIDALLDSKESDAFELVDHTLDVDGSGFKTEHPADLVSDLKKRNSVPRYLPEPPLRHPVKMVSDLNLQGPPSIAVSLPGYSAERGSALIAYTIYAGVLGWGEAELEKREGKWVVTRDSGPPEKASSKAIEDIPLRAGGDVKPPRLLKRVDPLYSTGLGGSAMIAELTINVDGKVKSATILTSRGEAADAAATAALLQWQFAPGTLNGKPVMVLFNVSLPGPR